MDKQAKNTPTTRTPTRQMRVRARIVLVLVAVLFFTANIVQLCQLQLVEGEDWQKRAVSQQMSAAAIKILILHFMGSIFLFDHFTAERIFRQRFRIERLPIWKRLQKSFQFSGQSGKQEATVYKKRTGCVRFWNIVESRS